MNESLSRDWRWQLACCFLLLQGISVAISPFGEHRYYCWRPHDQQVVYRYTVRVGGRELTPSEAYDRYRDSWRGINPRSFQHVIALVRQYEETYGAGDEAEVRLRYRINGSEEREWFWPPQEELDPEDES